MTDRCTRRAMLGRTAGIGAWLAAGCSPAATPHADRPAWIVRGGTVVTMNGALGTIDGADVLVRDGTIVEVGKDISAPGAERIDARGRIVLPGLVDTHWHMWNGIARGLARSAAGDFQPTMTALAKVWTAEASALGVRLSLAEAVDAGITSVANWAHNTRSPAHARAELEAMQRSGVRGRFCYGYPNDLDPERPMDIEDLAAVRRSLPGAGLVDLGVCLRGPERSAEAVWRKEWATARSLGLPLTTHIATTREEAAKGAIAKLAAESLLGPDVQLVHATHASAEELASIARSGSRLSISPWTELEVGYGIPSVAAAIAAGIPISLSVDNLLLTGRADMFSVMKLAADVARGSAERATAVSDTDALRWATLGGAADLGLAGRVGELVPGRRADLVMLRADRLGTAPHASVESVITRMAQPADVDLVMIDGVIHKRDGKLTRVDLPSLLREASSMLASLRQRAGV